MNEVYPAAQKAQMTILPAEMDKTDHDELSAKYNGIPTCCHPYDAEFFERLSDTISTMAKKENNDDPMHNYLIGLAYLEGIDVEVNRELGVSLIISAAKSDLPEAMRTLYDMYNEGKHVKLSYNEALKWIKKLSDYYIALYGDRHIDTLAALNDLSTAYGQVGEHKKALELEKKYMNCSVNFSVKSTLIPLIHLTILLVNMVKSETIKST